MQEKSIAGIRTRRSGGVVRIGRWLLERPRLLKRAVLVCIDFFILSIAIWVALCLRHKSLYYPTDPVETAVLLAGPVITLGVFAWFGFYKMVTRFMGARSTTSPAFSSWVVASGLRLSESCCAATTSRLSEDFPDADRV